MTLAYLTPNYLLYKIYLIFCVFMSKNFTHTWLGIIFA